MNQMGKPHIQNGDAPKAEAHGQQESQYRGGAGLGTGEAIQKRTGQAYQGRIQECTGKRTAIKGVFGNLASMDEQFI